ncbi:MAG: ROK family protein [Pantoea sp.]|uniref:ROK family protein n=1 Tax=Pantoea phytobeneficialis TaxID=2052056 RepID=A0AAP9H1J2_9GAMM|nr:ROK family protein [Pantoea phytobeneficialis]MDO6408275.1 ROK family protein [Pantoea phytobeneficialis]QGR04925.1 ROK family protein [Pantoea phytobeneficialis]
MKTMGKGPALLRLNNLKRVMTQLRQTRVTSRQDLAQALTLSKNTVSLIVDDLLAQGLINELGPVSVAAAGRPKIEISLRPEKLKSAGIMVERQAIHWRVCDYFSQVIAEQTWRSETSDPALLLQELVECCQALRAAHPELIGIAIGFPGIVDPQRGWMHFSSHLGWQDVDLLTPLRRGIDLPLRIMNNVKAAALLSVQQLALDKSQSHFYLRIAEGIGGALVQHGEVFTGSSWTAGEVGHLTVQPDGPRCSCGRLGCLEALVSQPAIQQQLLRRKPGLRWQNRDSEPAIVDAVLSEAGAQLGSALSQVMLLLNPASIMIDAAWNACPVFTRAVQQAAEASTLAFTFTHTALHFLPQRIDPANGLALAVIEQYEQRMD